MPVLWAEIDKLVQAYHCLDATSSEEALLRRLRVWWARFYSRPFKDPLLETYTLQELIHEFLTIHYLDVENDPLEKKRKESQLHDDEEWARKQLSKAAAQKAEKKPEPPKPPEPPTPIPNLPEISTSFDK